MANSPVKLSVVHPGGVLTNIVRNSRTGTGITDNARRAAGARTTGRHPPPCAQLRTGAGDPVRRGLSFNH